jgi:hypothetical protein
VRANRAYHLLHTPGGVGPALLAGEDRWDLVEVVSVDDGEVALFWELPAREAARLARALRRDLATLDAACFAERWRGADTRYGGPHANG